MRQWLEVEAWGSRRSVLLPVDRIDLIEFRPTDDDDIAEISLNAGPVMSVGNSLEDIRRQLGLGPIIGALPTDGAITYKERED